MGIIAKDGTRNCDLEAYPIANCDNAAGKIEQIRLLDFGMLWLSVLSLCMFDFFCGFIIVVCCGIREDVCCSWEECESGRW